MKRITKIEISNFRAFYDTYLVDFDKGENLLIYGENGSGKSSFYKSLNNFLSSSLDTALPYIKHHNKENDQGTVTFTFNDYDHTTNTISTTNSDVLKFGSTAKTAHTKQFVKTAQITKGFLDYKALLAVYNHNNAQPNLFALIVETLLKDFTPIGGTYPLGIKFRELRSAIETAYTTVTWQYRNAIPALANYEAILRTTLKAVFLQLNTFLMKYFKLNTRVWFSLVPFVAPPDSWRYIPTELRLDIKLNGKLITHQSDYLNEARLSALSICLYLAILKRNPDAIDYKVLFLDDVFIGLDLSNRLPILDILKNEFSDYQVFLSTYDRHLYELAKKKFETEVPERWKSIELFVARDQIGGQPVDLPILIVGESNFEKAVQYLHNRIKPDYPASANFFRKAIEELIKSVIPKWETVDAENIQLPDYKLNQLVLRTKRFLDHSQNSTIYIDNIISLLPALLHPLSHHEISSPIYRGELETIENSFIKLRQQLIDLDISTNFKCALDPKTRLKFTFAVDAAANHFCYYEIRLKEPLTLRRNGTSQPILSKVNCFTDCCYGINGTKPYPNKPLDKKKKEFNYNSLLDAYDSLYEFLISSPIGNFSKSSDYLSNIHFHDGSNWMPLVEKLVF